MKHVLLLSVDGMHDVDLVNFVRLAPELGDGNARETGVEYTSAQAPAPSDSYPGVLALVTGGSPKTTGVMYDEFYDRAVSPAMLPERATNSVPKLNFNRASIAIRQPSTAAASIRRSLRAIRRTAAGRFYPTTIFASIRFFEVVKANGGRTAWSDKHLGYEA